MSIFTHDISVSGVPVISVSGGQPLKSLKNGNFLICSFLSLHGGVWGGLPQKIIVAISHTALSSPLGGRLARGVVNKKCDMGATFGGVWGERPEIAIAD